MNKMDCHFIKVLAILEIVFHLIGFIALSKNELQREVMFSFR
ncbi:MAG: hypothetical protein ACOC79_00245 [Thermodesulfobacteriota bacterium]